MSTDKISSARLRELIFQVLPLDVDLDSFLLDYFPDVKRQTTMGMLRVAKIDLLMERHGVDAVFIRLRDVHPQKVATCYRQPVPSSNRTPPAYEKMGLLDALIQLQPSQFDELVFRLEVPTHHLPPPVQPIAIRAIELMRMVEARRELDRLQTVLGQLLA